MAAQGHVTCAAVLVAGGDGTRLGAEVPKAFVRLDGRTLLELAAARFADHPAITQLVVVAPADRCDEAAALVPGASVVPGGPSRQESVARGLAALRDDVTAVLIHDVARPFVPAEVIDRVVAALATGARAVVPALPVVDTVKQVRVDEHGVERVAATLPRPLLRAVQTPQGFARDVAVAAHAGGGSDAPDDAALAEAMGVAVVVVEGHEDAAKITRPRDLVVAAALHRAAQAPS